MKSFSVLLLAAAIAAPSSLYAMSGKPDQAEATATAATSVAETPAISAADVEPAADRSSYQIRWNSSQPVTLSVSRQADGSAAEIIASNLSSGEYQWTNSQPGQRWYFVLTPAEGQATVVASRQLPMPGGQNFRELGGYQTADGHTVKWGKIYRSGVLTFLSADDYQVIDGLKISTVADFRSIEERETDKTDWQASPVRRIEQDYYAGDFGFGELVKNGITRESAIAMMAGFYPQMAQQQKATYQAMFDLMVRHDETILYHCSAGKDRTGVASMLILTALGVPEDTIMNDYLASNRYLDPHKLSHGAKDGEEDEKAAKMRAFMKMMPPEALQALMGVEEEYLRATIDYMNKGYGSVMGYIQQELGVSEQDLQAMRSHYLI
ncbi:tyrosine-protein phosphatase [Oceanobacter mangrovi]|uniref:tyrosine-protein phosphatase n=1 Tax=Oceanobacter mangrovi TaxID=2862510 RepID=UPI001C8DA376|nr:tyrosine-protein phosphatase [Oceanobacter mangrovi]